MRACAAAVMVSVLASSASAEPSLTLLRPPAEVVRSGQRMQTSGGVLIVIGQIANLAGVIPLAVGLTTHDPATSRNALFFSIGLESGALALFGVGIPLLVLGQRRQYYRAASPGAKAEANARVTPR